MIEIVLVLIVFLARKSEAEYCLVLRFSTQVHEVGHSTIFQLLLQTKIITSIMVSPPVWIKSASTLSTPADVSSSVPWWLLYFFHELLYPLLLILKLATKFCPSVKNGLFISLAFSCSSWVVEDFNSFSFFKFFLVGRLFGFVLANTC